MKIIFLVLLSLLVTSQAFSQKKGKVDPKDVTIDSLKMVTVGLTGKVDSLTKSNASLTMDLDSSSKVFDSLYIPIKNKVIKKDFDPNRTSVIIDSLRTSRDATLAGLQTTMTDSVTVLNAEITKLKTTIATMEAAKANKEALVAELKQLKELLDGGMISQAEYDAKKAKLMEKWE